MGAVIVVDVQPRRQGLSTALIGGIRADVGPFLEQGAVEALHIAVGLGMPGLREALHRTALQHGGLEGEGTAVHPGVVGEDALDHDAMGGEKRCRPGPERTCGWSTFMAAISGYASREWSSTAEWM